MKTQDFELNTIYISERIMERLRVISKYALTVVTAPMGYGKTTAVNWFLSEKSKTDDSVVIRISIYSDNMTLFWKSIQNAFAYSGIDFLKDYMLPSDTVGSGMLMDELCRTLSDGRQYYIFVDDYHLLSNDKVSEFICKLSAVIPDNVHIIVATRNAFLKNSDVVKLGSKLHTIEKEHLSLNFTELAVYANRCGFDFNDKDVEELFKQSEGWFSAIYFSLRTFAESGKMPKGNKDIYETFMSVMIDPLPETLREFLAVMGLADEFTAEMAEYVTGIKDVENILKALTGQNSFVTLLSDGKTYRFHHMMKECSSRMFNTLAEEKKKTYLGNYGKWYENTKQYIHALDAYEKNGSFNEILGVIEKDAGILLASSGPKRICEIMAKCGDEELKKHPTALLVLMRRMFTWRQIPEMMKLKALLETAIEENKDLSEEDKGNLLGERDLVMSFLMYNDIKAMSALHRSASSLMSRLAVSMRNEGSWTFGSPSVLMMFHRTNGEINEEIAAMNECMPYYYKLTDGHGFGAEMVMEAEAAFMQCRYDDAAIALEKASNNISGKGQINMELCCDFLENRLSLCHKDSTFVSTDAKRAGLIRLHDTMWINIFDCTCAYYYALKSDTANIPEVFREHKLSEINFLMPCKPMMEMIENQVYLAQGTYVKVIGRLEELIGICKGMHYALVEIHIMVQAAAAFEKLEKFDKAEEILEKAIESASPDMILMPFVENYKYISEILKRRKSDLRSEFVEKIKTFGEIYTNNLLGLDSPELMELNEKEKEIVNLLLEHYSNKEIAEKLFLSEGTVKQYLNRIYAKLSLEGDSHDKRKQLIKLLQ